MADSYTTRFLVAVLAGLDRPQSFLLDTFFPELMEFETERVEFDKMDRMVGLAPFCSPLARGKAVAARGFATESFAPAYVKPKNEIDISRPFKRRPGETYGGDMTPAMRRDMAVADTFEDQLARIIRRKEWMASSVLRTGAVTVAGDDYPATSVDFGRDASLTVALAAAARWGEAGVSPFDDIETWSGLVATASGAAATTVVMDPKAWALARKDDQIAKALDYRYARPTEVEIGPLARGEARWATYVGSVGQFDFWVYSQPFVDVDGTAGNMMPAYTVIIGAQGVEAGVGGYQAHGAIKDPRAGYQAMEVFPKTWVEEDPAAEWAMSQSAPLVVPARVNACFCATVR